MSQASLEIIRGLAQAAANAYDGAYDSDGEPLNIGLKREEGHLVLSSRDMDGFKVRVMGDTCIINYQAEIKLRDVHNPKFESEVDQTVGNIVTWLKKEFKKITGKTLTLTDDGEIDVLVQSTSKIRVFILANKKYKIGNMTDVEGLTAGDESPVEKKFKDFLALGGFKKSSEK